jgi:hypothetical protein
MVTVWNFEALLNVVNVVGIRRRTNDGCVQIQIGKLKMLFYVFYTTSNVIG